jgi:hypothetical protein
MGSWAVVVVVVAVAVAVMVFAWKADQKRRLALQAWASHRGWTYVDRNDEILGRFDGSPFESGHSRRATTVMSGKLGQRQATVFGYQYTVSNGKSSTTYHFRIFAVAMPCFVGHLEVKPEGLFAKLGNKLGFADVQLESEAFNREYRLTASSQKLAYDLVPARNIELLLGRSGVDLRTEGDLMMLVEDGTLDVASIDGQLELLAQFIDNVPPFVWKDHGAEQTAEEPPGR